MQPRNWFGLAIRIAGLVFFVFATFDVFYAVAKLAGLEVQSKFSAGTDMAAAAYFLSLAAVGVLGAERIVNLAYGTRQRE